MPSRLPQGHLAAITIDPAAAATAQPGILDNFTTIFAAQMSRGFPFAITPQLTIASSDAVIRQHLVLSAGQPPAGTLTWDQTITIASHSCTIDLTRVQPTALRNQGYGKQLLSNALAWYDHMAIDTLNGAPGLEDGGYFWARAGFVPDASSWSALTNDFESLYKRCRPQDPRYWDALQRLWSKGPTVFNAIASVSSGFGREFLRGKHWGGSLCLNDPQRYAIIRAYIP